MAITSIRHKGLAGCGSTMILAACPPKRRPSFGACWRRCTDRARPEKLARAALLGWRVHPFKGDVAGFWSLSVTGSWRLIVRFEGGNALDIDLVDYH